MTETVAIIGAGQIGFEAWDAFGAEEWDCLVCSRTKPGWLERVSQDFKQYTAGTDTPPEADVVVDTIAFDAQDVAKYDPDKIGRLILISSASVYCDDQGRTLDEAAHNGFPEFGGAISESQSTVPPGPETYSTRKVRMENAARERFGDRVTILRPCAIYGTGSRHPREWWFVKRFLDGRTHIPLAHLGQSQFQTTAASWIGDVALKCAETDAGGVFNVADAGAYSVLEIGRTVASVLKREVEFVPINVSSASTVGRTPWSVPRPFITDGTKCDALFGHPAPAYYPRAYSYIEFLAKDAPSDWRAEFPQLAAYPWDLFDYQAEDRFFDEIL